MGARTNYDSPNAVGLRAPCPGTFTHPHQTYLTSVPKHCDALSCIQSVTRIRISSPWVPVRFTPVSQALRRVSSNNWVDRRDALLFTRSAIKIPCFIMDPHVHSSDTSMTLIQFSVVRIVRIFWLVAAHETIATLSCFRVRRGE
jgi:hypothetical protein